MLVLVYCIVASAYTYVAMVARVHFPGCQLFLIIEEARSKRSYMDRRVISPSLINPDWGDLTRPFNPDFDLGIPGFYPWDVADLDFPAALEDQSSDTQIDVADQNGQMELLAATSSRDAEDTTENPPKHKKLSLQRSTKRFTNVATFDQRQVPLKDSTNQSSRGASRFAEPISSPEREKAARGVIPANTESNTQWAVRTFNAWAQNRSFINPTEAVPVDLLESQDPEVICKWFCRFVMETRKNDGSPYPPASLRSLLCGLNRVLQRNKAPFSVMDKTDHRFRDLQKTLDSLSSDLHRQGVGAVKHTAKVIDPKHEDIFWQKGLLGYSTPKVLQRTVFFYTGLHFVLRGIQEQHDLVPLQFTREPQDRSVYHSSVYYEYIEFVSKNNQHRFKDINMRSKKVRAYAVPGSERCIVKLLDTYLPLLPSNSPNFYMRALEKFPSDPKKCCMTNQRVGINMLKNILSELSEKAGLETHYTNHSLRATAITRMFNSGIPEKVIAENSGHRSTKALRCYERTSQEQQQTATRVINCPSNTNATEPVKEASSEFIPFVASSTSESKPLIGAQSLGGFSGNFTNCTINISLK